MIKLVDNFPNQLKHALSIANAAILNEPNIPIQNIVITGLGGSGIGGTIIAETLLDKLMVPVVVNKDYFLPAFVNENTLLIVSSYSGNTEETVEAMQQAITKKAQIVCITSGGKILELAKQNFTTAQIVYHLNEKEFVAKHGLIPFKILCHQVPSNQKNFRFLPKHYFICTIRWR